MAETTRTTPGSPAPGTPTPTSPGGTQASSPPGSTPGSTAGSAAPGRAAAPFGSSDATSAPISPAGQQPQAQRQQGQQNERRQERQGEHRQAHDVAHAMSDAKRVGSELVGAARASAMSLLDAQRNRAADQIAAVGEALRRSAEALEETSGASLVRYADRAAEQIDGFADAMRNRSWSELAGDVESFARRWPIVYTASAVAIGFVAGRFMLSSAEPTRATRMPGAMPPESRTETSAAPTGARAGYGSPASGE